MSLPAFKRLYPSDYLLQQLEGNVAQAIGPVLQSAILSAVQIDSIQLAATTPFDVVHKLGRQPRGWFLADINAAANVWRTAWSTTTLTLEASADVTVALWVF